MNSQYIKEAVEKAVKRFRAGVISLSNNTTERLINMILLEIKLAAVAKESKLENVVEDVMQSYPKISSEPIPPTKLIPAQEKRITIEQARKNAREVQEQADERRKLAADAEPSAEENKLLEYIQILREAYVKAAIANPPIISEQITAARIVAEALVNKMSAVKQIELERDEAREDAHRQQNRALEARGQCLDAQAKISALETELKTVQQERDEWRTCSENVDRKMLHEQADHNETVNRLIVTNDRITDLQAELKEAHIEHAARVEKYEKLLEYAELPNLAKALIETEARVIVLQKKITELTLELAKHGHL